MASVICLHGERNLAGLIASALASFGARLSIYYMFECEEGYVASGACFLSKMTPET